MLIETLSTFPHMYDSVMGESMMKRAQEKGILEFRAHDLRDWTHDRHRTTDDDPYGGGGSHIQDVGVVMPIFVEGEIFCYVADKCHWSEMGGKDPGYSLNATEIYQEGLQMPCVKLFNEGVLNEDIADIITNKAKNFIASHKEEPFFLYMGTQDVHVPRVPHPRFAGKSGLGTRGDVILQLDWTIGEIMNTLDSLQLTDNTILIFTSDNGPVIDDGYQDQAFERLNGHTPMGIYRGGKYSAYEAGTRIPFIVRWPAKVKPNKQQALFSQIDIFASLAALLKQPLPEGAAPDSQEHLNTLLGKDYTSREYIVQQNLNNTLAIVKGQWKYIEPSDAPAIEYWTKMELGNDRHPQLYDLSADPSEKNNVAKQHPEVVRELSELLESVKTR